MVCGNRATSLTRLTLVALLCCGAGCADGNANGNKSFDQTGTAAGGHRTEISGFVPVPLRDTGNALSGALGELGFTETVDQVSAEVGFESGRLKGRVRDNSGSPEVLSGIQSLVYMDGDQHFEAFRAGWNLEYVFSGHRDDQNRFAPRRHPYQVCRESEGDSVFLVRLASQSPWSVEHVTRLTPAGPHSIDIDFRCRFLDVSRFGARKYAVFFWANYMRELHDAVIHFRGVDGVGEQEQWIRAESFGGWDVGTFLQESASILEFDDDHNLAFNLRSFPSPRFTCPLLLSRSAGNMVFILMFDRLKTGDDEFRFSSFPPAVDVQYVIHDVRPEHRYGFRARMSWRPWTSEEDCWQEYRSWQAGLVDAGARENSQPRNPR